MIKTTNSKGKVTYYKLKKFIKLINKDEINLSSVRVEVVKAIDELKKLTR